MTHWQFLLRLNFIGLLTVLSVTGAEPKAGVSASAPQPPAPAATASEDAPFKSQLKPFLAKYCLDCHGNRKQKADINFESFKDSTRLIESRKHWEAVREKLQGREMPPEDKPQPSQEERDRVVHFIETQLAQFDCTGEVNPGQVTLRRLNRSEYNNTIRDLVGLDLNLAADFPSDEVGYGFDNIGDVLSLPPILMEKYLNAAEQVASRAIVTEYPPKTPSRRIPGEELTPKGDEAIRTMPGQGLGLYREGEGWTTHQFSQAGKYQLRVRAYGEQAGLELPRMAVRMDDQEVKVYTVKSTNTKPEVFELPIEVEAGTHRVAVAYLNNYSATDHPDPKLRGDRNLFVKWIEVTGPLDVPPPPLPASHTRIMTCDPSHAHTRDCAVHALRGFASRAWRRPATDQEVERLAQFVDLAQKEKASFLEGIQVAIQAVLASPKFLFRWELDPERDQPAGQRELNDDELASRLSYFLWSSMPDERLFDLARQGALKKEGVLQSEVQRMLQDPKAEAMVKNFAGQWLQIRNLASATPDPGLFPEFNDELRQAMARETELFFQSILKENRSVLDFIDADFTFVNGKLAEFYGIPDVQGDAFQRVALDKKSGRGGILTQASILTITSNPTRTSPVLRGKWILEQILGTPPPPPPPNVPLLEETPEAAASASLRERLELHRSKPECATCHSKMDPLGFAFENFNAIGQWRDLDGKFRIDPAGILPTGESFKGPNDLKSILKSRDTFVRSLAEKVLTFALGRGLEYYDKCVVDDLCAGLARDEYRITTLITGVVRSAAFLKKNVGHGTQTASLKAGSGQAQGTLGKNEKK